MPSVTIEYKDEQLYTLRGNYAVEMVVPIQFGMHIKKQEFRSLCFISCSRDRFLCYAIDINSYDVFKFERVYSEHDDSERGTVKYVSYSWTLVLLDELKEYVRPRSSRCYEHIKDITDKDREKLMNITFGRINVETDLFIKWQTQGKVLLMSVSKYGSNYDVCYAELSENEYNKHFENMRYMGDVFSAFVKENSDFSIEMGNRCFRVRMSKNQLMKTEPPKNQMAILKDTVTKYTRKGFMAEKEEKTNLTECWHNLACYMRYLIKNPQEVPSDRVVYVSSLSEYVRYLAGNIKEYFLNRKKDNRNEFFPDYIPSSSIHSHVSVKRGAWLYEGLR